MSVSAIMNNAQAIVEQNIQEQYLKQLNNAPTTMQTTTQFGLQTQSTISSLAPNS